MTTRSEYVAPEGTLVSHPSIPQGTFLENVGIDARVVTLLREGEGGEEEAEKVVRAFERLVGEMGSLYHVYCVSSSDLDLSEYMNDVSPREE